MLPKRFAGQPKVYCKRFSPLFHLLKTASLRVEYEQLQVDLMGRYKALENQFSFPERSALEDNSAFLLHAVCRLSKPANVLETGVSNGHSTFFLLQALQ